MRYQDDLKPERVVLEIVRMRRKTMRRDQIIIIAVASSLRGDVTYMASLASALHAHKVLMTNTVAVKNIMMNMRMRRRMLRILRRR
jgi:hypothetical protein